MNDAPISIKQPEQAETRQQKITYSRPVLRVYGAVTKLTQGSNGTVGDGMSVHAGMQKSDRRAKENIIEIGRHPLGIGLYLFDYKPEFRAAWGYGKQLGVMADEVESVRPQAVGVDRDGYKMVDYAALN